jgi:hypothetical protein
MIAGFKTIPNDDCVLGLNEHLYGLSPLSSSPVFVSVMITNAFG